MRSCWFRRLTLTVMLAGVLAGAFPAPQVQAVTCGVWTRVPSADPDPSTNSLAAVDAIASDDVWAVGARNEYPNGMRALAEHWDGVSWTSFPTPNVPNLPEWLLGVAAIAPDDVWAVGITYDGSSNMYGALLLHFDGASWSQVTAPAVPTGESAWLSSITAVPGTNELWVVGWHAVPYEAHDTLVMHYDGSSWSIVTSPNPGDFQSELFGVSAVSGTDVWAVGDQIDFTFVKTTAVLHWNGTAWKTKSSPNVGTKDNLLLGVSALSSTAAWAVGRHGKIVLIERWNGTSWVTESPPDLGTGYFALLGVHALSRRNVWGVGYDGFNTLIEHRGRRKWFRVASPSPGSYDNQLGGVDATSPTDVWAVGDTNSGSKISTLVLHRC